MRQIASGILFTMNELQRKKSQPDSIKTQEDCNGKHIMISYNHASKETCLKIKQELESNILTFIHSVQEVGAFFYFEINANLNTI